MIERRIGPHLGVVASLDPEYISDLSASDSHNVIHEDGTLQLRRGYRNIVAADQTLDPDPLLVRGAFYMSGYTGGTLVEEYVVFQRFNDLGGAPPAVNPYSRPYAYHVSNGTKTEITAPGPVSLTLANSDWRGVMGNGNVAYFFAVGGDGSYPFAQYTLGDPDSWIAYKPPATPTTKITVLYHKNASQGFSYATLRWAGLADADVAKTGVAATCALTNDYWETEHTAGTPGTASIEVDLSLITAGVQNWQNNDVFRVPLHTPDPDFSIDWENIRVTLTNNDGTPISEELRVAIQNPDSGSAQSVQPRYLWLKFPAGKVRANWDNTRKIKFEYQVTESSGAANTNRLRIGPMLVGCITDWGDKDIEVGYSAYNGTTTQESGIGGVIKLPLNALKNGLATREPGQGGGAFTAPSGFELGTIPELTVSNPSDADNTRLYIRDGKDWRRVGTEQSDADLTYTFTTSRTDFESLTVYENKGFSFNDILVGCSYKGWWVWGREGGVSNIRHSRVGEPVAESSEFDQVIEIDGLPPDLNRGENFTLRGSDGPDEPVNIFECGDALVILGKQGAYAQVPMQDLAAPWNMSPPRQIPGAPGAYDFWASAKWRDPGGTPGVIYVSADYASGWFLQVSSSFDGNHGFLIQEFTQKERGLIRDFLLAGNDPTDDVYKINVAVNPLDDSIWIQYTFRAMVCRRPSLVDGERHWELYTFNRGTGVTAVNWQHMVGCTRWGMRGFRVAYFGMDEFEYDSSLTFAPIVGATRDGGASISTDTAYWESKAFVGPSRRTFYIDSERSVLSELPKVIITSDRQTSSAYTWGSGQRRLKVGPLNQGRTIKYKFFLPVSGSAIYRHWIIAEDVIGDRWNG